MRRSTHLLVSILLVFLMVSCKNKQSKQSTTNQQSQKEVTAKDILGNSNYLAISYGGYRKSSRDIQPTIEELKEDMRILHAMNIRILRTYNVQLAQASNMLKAIRELKKETPGFEMYVMLGTWIDCKNAWTDQPLDHHQESEHNAAEIARAIALANEYPEVVKVISVGNEAMVKWAASYFVQPDVILKWVMHLQDLKTTGDLSKDLWITSSDNFASWGGAESQYHVEALEKLMAAVDYVSAHTYPMHDTHYNPVFWGVFGNETELSSLKRIEIAMNRATDYAASQIDSVASYMKRLGIDKPIHVGETGWASASNRQYGSNGSKATDEYKEAIYYHNMRVWSDETKRSCFYFEAFDEPWKDAQNIGGSENYFGLFTVDGKAKYALWDLVDKGVFDGLTRNGNPITKTYNGNKEALLLEVELPPLKNEIIMNH